MQRVYHKSLYKIASSINRINYGFTNDLFKTGEIINDVKNFFPTNIENNVIIGSNSTILPVNICSGAVIGAGSVVTKDIDIKGTYAGNPAKLLRKF